MVVNDFHSFFDTCLALSFDDCLYRRRFDFGTFLASYSMFFRDRFLNESSDVFLIDFVRFPRLNESQAFTAGLAIV